MAEGAHLNESLPANIPEDVTSWEIKREGGLPVKVHCNHTAMVALADLKPYPNNPNKHTDDQLLRLAKIFEHQGVRSPAVVSIRSGFVVKGNGSIAAAKLLGMQYYPVDYQDFPDSKKERLYVVGDNQIAELSTLDTSLVKDIMLELDAPDVDLTLMGFSPSEIEKLLQPDNKKANRKNRATDPEFSKFELTMKHANKERWCRLLDKIRKARKLETLEEAIVILCDLYDTSTK